MLTQEVLIAPSVLAANFSHLEEDIKRVERSGAKVLHLDVMDGHFVPNISFGPSVVHTIDNCTNLVLDTHLMIEQPDQYLEKFKQAGSDIVTVHVEVCNQLKQTVSKIKDLGMKAGVSLNPATPLSSILEILPFADLILIMSVNPGFGGQKFIEESLMKIRQLSEIIMRQNLQTIVEVDGGIDSSTIQNVIDAGAHYIVAGNAVFGDGNIEKNFTTLNSFIR